MHENIMKLLMNSTTLDEETKLIPSRMMLEEGGVSIRLTDVDIPDIMITANGRSYSNKEL